MHEAENIASDLFNEYKWLYIRHQEQEDKRLDQLNLWN